MVEAFPDHAVLVLTVQQDAPGVRARLDRYRTLLSPDERDREAQFHFDADRERFVIGRALARLQLSRYLGGDPRQWAFVTNAHGRPEVLAPTGVLPVGFNVSHTSGLVALAMAPTHDVGVDVERIDRALTHDIADRFFAPAEVAALRALPGGEQPRVFFDYWTLKEAYIKARGMGLALPLRHFAFQLRPPARPTIVFDPEIEDDARTWQFAQAWPTPRHRLAVAVRRTGIDLDVRIEDIVPRVDA
ncbi:MAG: 4'-phosphopantetheinyl transferase superfamily protein [Acidobacteria bacterium]|nr:4'-phosphopantetheinyl transferase superfamily protein [Acidobacteriota bacterium]